MYTACVGGDALKTKKAATGAVAIFLIISMLISPEEAIASAKNALALCANVLVPSLLPFLVCSGILVRVGFAELISRPMSHVMRPLFGVRGAGAMCLVLGIVSGYPMGASCVCDMYEQGALDRCEAEKLLALCNNSGPLFVIGSVGGAMYMSRDIGIMLYAVHIAAALLSGIVIGISARKKEHTRTDGIAVACSKPIGTVIGEAVGAAATNMLNICVLTVSFSVLIGAMSSFLGRGALYLLIGGISEISAGVYNISTSALPLATRLVAVSAVMGFAGISVHLQVGAIASRAKLSMKLYFAGKLLHASFAAVLAKFALHTFSVSAFVETSGNACKLPSTAEIIWLSFAYFASAVVVLLAFVLAEKICIWQEKVKYRK